MLPVPNAQYSVPGTPFSAKPPKTMAMENRGRHQRLEPQHGDSAKHVDRLDTLTRSWRSYGGIRLRRHGIIPLRILYPVLF